MGGVRVQTGGVFRDICGERSFLEWAILFWAGAFKGDLFLVRFGRVLFWE